MLAICIQISLGKGFFRLEADLEISSQILAITVNAIDAHYTAESI